MNWDIRFPACARAAFSPVGRWGNDSSFGVLPLGHRGQATVEGAFLIPVILLMLMMLVQPGILLYDRMVMSEAASEGCRLIATWPASESNDACEGYIRRRLGSVPHVQPFPCTWKWLHMGHHCRG